MLADGSRLELAPMSRVRLDFTQERREAWLQGGHVFFAVAHDRSRPFIVHAGGLRITAVGTAFDVRDAARDVMVTVSEGHVNVSADGRRPESPPRVAPELVQAAAGERVTFSKPMYRLSLASVDLELAESWRKGVLQFVAEPLDQVVAEVALYSPRPIVLGDSELGKLRFTGTVSQAHLDDWLAALEAVFSVRIIDRGPDGILIRAAPVPKVSSHEGS
jgi:transmembrane sensor